MLTELREKSQSFGIYVLFGILIIVFIFFFGPQSEGCQPGATRTSLTGWAAEVNGEEVSQREVEISVRRQALFDPDFDADEAELTRLRRDTAAQVAQQVLLEQRARQVGLAVGEADLSAFIVSKDNPDSPLFTDREGNFDTDRYRGQLTQALAATTEAYRDTKRRELLVNHHLDFLATQVKVSPAEVREAFDRARRTWNLEYVAFDPAEYAADAVAPTPEEGKAWAAAHVDDVARYYDEHKKEYDRDTEVHIRRVLVRKPKEGGDAALAEARAKAEALLAEARAEGADFEAIAREKSEGYYKNYGGDMGWQSKENSSPKDFEVYAALTAGQISDVQESPIGFWFVRAEEIKPAMKKTLDEVRDEIGTILAGEAKRTEAARAAAEAVLAKVKAGAKLSEAAPMKQAPAPAAPEGEAPEGDAPEAASPEPVSTLESTGPFSADRPAWDRIPGIGKSAELAAKLDALTAEAPLVDQVLEVEGRLFVVALKERVEPDDEAFAKDRETFERRLRIGRANQLFGNWKAVVYGPVRQREVFRRFTGGALLDVLDHAEGVRLNDELYPPPAAPALPEGAMPIKLN